ncbi:hypothetical protein MKZ38_004257 [Zalerion maritima]|uniref:Uncharacterized protein n=1 Tax=Zalerion maritima TaxID=339359 RepID=A0AAD5WRS9_9PEZI|nr:hypothetical protein MKZ38_004257 [Zalerion maritima]
MSTNGAANPPPSDKASADQNTDLSKDQVGWYFVEQYYNTVSKNPEKLHLFYGKKSQFVYGVEAEVAKISVGRQPIQERIKQLDFQDCKVRISNVDTQASYDNIVIQVIGEFSNKGGEPRKFAQTFILAQQPSGYFVLNDILRCIDDDESEEDATETREAQTAPEPAEEKPETTGEDEPVVSEKPAVEMPAVTSFDAGAMDKKLEEVGETPQTETPTTESVTEAAEPTPEPTQDVSGNPTPNVQPPDPEVTVKEIAEEDAKEPEKPKDPSPTPVGPKAAPPEPETPADAAPATATASSKPMTWASRLAASTGGAPRPVVPLKAATPPAPAQTRAPVPAPAPAPAQPAQAAQASSQPAEAATSVRKADASEWQTAGENSKRQNRPQSMVGTSGDKESTSCYVKYVSDKVQHDDLKSALSAHGELTYFDINRQKNCAFAEYASVSAYQTAIAASPYTVNGESITVEPRRKPGSYGGGGYGPGRGGMTGRGRGGFEGGRSGSQGGRGGFGSQGGGRGRGAPRGSRGAAQVGSS